MRYCSRSPEFCCSNLWFILIFVHYLVRSKILIFIHYLVCSNMQQELN